MVPYSNIIEYYYNSFYMIQIHNILKTYLMKIDIRI